jgi:hypothetical protein
MFNGKIRLTPRNRWLRTIPAASAASSTPRVRYWLIIPMDEL